MNDLIPALAATAGPVLLLAPVVWSLRRQCGRHVDYNDPHRPVRPAAAILARLADEVDTGEIPRNVWGGVDRPALWTVPGDDIAWTSTADRDLTGAFPVVVAR